MDTIVSTALALGDVNAERVARSRASLNSYTLYKSDHEPYEGEYILVCQSEGDEDWVGVVNYYPDGGKEELEKMVYYITNELGTGEEKDFDILHEEKWEKLQKTLATPVYNAPDMDNLDTTSAGYAVYREGRLKLLCNAKSEEEALDRVRDLSYRFRNKDEFRFEELTAEEVAELAKEHRDEG
jgi:hypothetical protein